ncbi:type II CAAX prenyl endopeptidase Rce1 family protein [Desulfosediminicola flagellatus]|uniref:CPBP family glutamic-type intramembrane protease n=1 Tax=Desulfosediminicola flagellatus TaxID=2569541 RepID=UPI0010AD9719|nr:CPBP family glutamic-type intramembrane protease [Desulfosediminicola flagellatus]
MINNRRLLVPFAAPFLAYVFIASALGDFMPIEMNYGLRIVACVALLVWGWKWYMPMTGPKSVSGSVITGVVTGIIGLAVWIVLLTPFADASEAEPWSGSAFMVRLLTAGLLVPVFEEIMMRGFVFRLALQWWEARKRHDSDPLITALDDHSVNTVLPGAWSWPAVIISTVVFASGHNTYEWPASIGFGLLMTGLWIVRKDLISCIVAHGVTNITLAIYVVKTDSWFLW